MTTKVHAVELWEVSKLVPYAQNAKKHPPEQVKKLAAAIKEFGWTQPIIVDADGCIIVGHGRRLAAIELGYEKVPVVCRRDLTPTQVRALRLSDNRVASTEYDMSLVQAELSEILADAGDLDLSSMGYDERELDFADADLGEMSDDFYADDVGEAVEKQKAENEKKAKETDDTAAPVADALGFKRVTIAQSRELRNIMGRVEGRYSDKKGAEALIDFLSRALGDQ